MPASRDLGRPGGGTLLKTRVSVDLKARFSALAKKRGVKKSALVRQLVANAVGEPASAEDMSARSDEMQSQRRFTVRLDAADRRSLRSRAKSRNVRVSRYLAALVRAHLNNDIRPLAAEMAMMRDLITELNTIGIGLNHLVRAANDGVVWVEPLKETLEQVLAILDKLGTRLTSFGQANRTTWKAEPLVSVAEESRTP